MGNPQQPEIRRSAKVPFEDQDAVEAVVEATRPGPNKGRVGSVPDGNRPGHHPDHEQDKPDPEAFAARFRREDEEPGG